MTARHRRSVRVLGPHDGAGGPRRARLPAGRAVGRGAAPRRSRLARNAARGAAGPVRGRRRRRVALSAAHQLARRRCRRPRIPMPSGRCWASSTCTCSTRAATSQLADALGANVADHRRRAGRALRGLGAQRRARLGGRRLQRLGRAAPSRCGCAIRPASGSCSCRASPPARATSTTSSAPGGVRLPHKADPVAQQAEVPPGTASIVASPQPFRWTDDEWMRRPRAAPGAAGADLDLRGACRLVAAGPASRAARCGISPSSA